MKQDEFVIYLEDLVQEARTLNPFKKEKYEKAGFQGVVMGLLSCDKENTFTGKQVAEIINTVLNYKSPGNEGSTVAEIINTILNYKDPGNEGSTGQRK